MINDWKNIKNWQNDKDKEKVKYLQKNLSQYMMSTTNLTWAVLRLNPVTVAWDCQLQAWAMPQPVYGPYYPITLSPTPSYPNLSFHFRYHK